MVWKRIELTMASQPTAPSFRDFAGQVKRLSHALAALEPVAAAVGIGPPAGQEWFDLLRRKLLPQLELPPMLIVAIVGGTNIGKSVLFNNLAGEVASAVSPLAAGTKHPVCLAPPGLSDSSLLARLFESFQLHAWHTADDPLQETAEHRLFWRTGAQTPPQLLLLDAPDVDSDATVNWERARAIRQTADVLVAVLTQQKYNDAAVKQFFRAAVEADKPILVVFNLCHLDDDRQYWPLWLSTFCQQTGARPELAYVAPYDRAAAEELRLPLYRVADGEPLRAANLREDLASLHFDAIKIRTFRGAVGRVLDTQHGAPAYLATIRAAAGEFSAAAAALSDGEMARVAWPTLPASVLVDEIGLWWDAARSQWSRQIHSFYRLLGRGATWPIRAAWRSLAADNGEPLEAFHKCEREAIVLAVEKLLDELDRLSRVGNQTLRPRLERLLGGHARATLLDRIEEAHRQLPPLDDDYRAFLRAELDAWKDANPRAVRFLQTLDHAAAVARPAITISLAVSGWALAGGLAGHVAIHSASRGSRSAA